MKEDVSKNKLKKLIEFRNERMDTWMCDVVSNGEVIGAIPMTKEETDAIRYYYSSEEEKKALTLYQYLFGPANRDKYTELVDVVQNIHHHLLGIIPFSDNNDSNCYEDDPIADDFDIESEFEDDKWFERLEKSLDFKIDSMQPSTALRIAAIDENLSVEEFDEPMYIKLSDSEYVEIMNALKKYRGRCWDELWHVGSISDETYMSIRRQINDLLDRCDCRIPTVFFLDELNKHADDFWGNSYEFSIRSGDEDLFCLSFSINYETISIKFEHDFLIGSDETTVDGISTSKVKELLGLSDDKKVCEELYKKGKGTWAYNSSILKWFDENGVTYNKVIKRNID